MTLLLDTHVLVWISSDDRRLSAKAREAIANIDADLFVSGVNAYEYLWLWQDGRIRNAAPFSGLVDRLQCTVLDYPADAWRIVERLPAIHGDPIDRMMIAHAIASDLTLVSCDENVAKYPVRVLW